MRLTCRSSLFTPWLSLLLSVTLLLSLAVCIPSVALALPTQQYEPTAINFDSAVVDDRSDGDSGHVAKRSQDINGTDVTLDPRAREGVYCHHPNAGNSGQCFLSWDRLWDREWLVVDEKSISTRDELNADSLAIYRFAYVVIPITISSRHCQFVSASAALPPPSVSTLVVPMPPG